MSQFPSIPVVIACGMLAACSGSNTPEAPIQNDETTPMVPVASDVENGRQFLSLGRVSILANQMSNEVTSALNTLNEAVTTGTSGENAFANNCLAGFDAGIGKPVADFSCLSEAELSATTATVFSGQVSVTDYCEAALATQQAQNCALQDATIGLPLEWIADATGTPTPLLATTITYLDADKSLTINTPDQLGLTELICVYDMGNDGSTDEATAAECFDRLVEVSDRLEPSDANLSPPFQGVEI